MNKVFCPNCYEEFEDQPDYCNCGYPFNGTEKEKYDFMSVRVKTDQTIQEGNKSARYARLILFIIGGVNLLVSIVQLLKGDNSLFYLIGGIYSMILIALGFFSYIKPFFSLLVGFILIVVIYLASGIVDTKLLLSGLPYKIIFIFGFIYGLYKIKQSDKIKQRE